MRVFHELERHHHEESRLMSGKYSKRILYSGYLVFSTFIMLEIGVRFWGYSEHHIYDPIYTQFESSKDIPYVHKPNLWQARGRGLAVINTDSLGLRSMVSGTVYGQKEPDEYRIGIVGDSITFGEGVHDTADTFPQVLEDLLNQSQKRKVKVFNFGSSAYSLREMLATLSHRMVDIQPDLVVMAIGPPVFNLFRTPTIDSAGYLIDQTVLSLPIPETMYHFFRKVHLLYAIRDTIKHWFFHHRIIDSLPLDQDLPESYSYIQRFKETSEKLGFHYVVLLLPRLEENPWGPLPDQMKQDGIRHLNLASLRKEFTRDQYMASRFDAHASPVVHHRIGESLAEYVQHQPGFVQ